MYINVRSLFFNSHDCLVYNLFKMNHNDSTYFTQRNIEERTLVFFAVLSLKHQSSSVWPKVNQKVFSSTSPPALIINEQNNIKYNEDGVFWGRGIFSNGERRRIRRCQPQGAFKWSSYFSFTLTLPLSCHFFLSESFSVSLTKDTAASNVLFLLHHCQ